MINKSNQQTKMSMLSLQKRINSFDEVMLGYTEEEAILEANRCLNCKKPSCVEKCPVQNHIPQFISCIQQRDFDKAFE